MPKKKGKKYLLIITALLGLAATSTAAVFAYTNNQNNTPTVIAPKEPSPSVPNENKKPPVDSDELYQGVSTSIANDFTIKVPNGWCALISENANFLAIMFARPNQHWNH